jgi:hypothetical protein
MIYWPATKSILETETIELFIVIAPNDVFFVFSLVPSINSNSNPKQMRQEEAVPLLGSEISIILGFVKMKTEKISLDSFAPPSAARTRALEQEQQQVDGEEKKLSLSSSSSGGSLTSLSISTERNVVLFLLVPKRKLISPKTHHPRPSLCLAWFVLMLASSCRMHSRSARQFLLCDAHTHSGPKLRR